MGLRRLQQTPVADRLYNVLLKNDGRVTEDEFIMVLDTMYSGRSEDRFELTMRCYLDDGEDEVTPNSTVAKREIMSVLTKSWQAAWKAL